jgi:hypothetical protein
MVTIVHRAVPITAPRLQEDIGSAVDIAEGISQVASTDDATRLDICTGDPKVVLNRLRVLIAR